MELHEKLQELRRQKGLTQEEVATALFVSRTAVSKWESGRGYPNLDSLRRIATLYSVTVDDLLSGEALLAVAEESEKEKEARLRDLVCGLLDCAAALFLFLPLFAQRADGTIRAVSLLSLTEIAPFIRIVYFFIVITSILWGIATLALQMWRHPLWMMGKGTVSLLLSGVGVLAFVFGLQPYAAVFLLVFLLIKCFLVLKRR